MRVIRAAMNILALNLHHDFPYISIYIQQNYSRLARLTSIMLDNSLIYYALLYGLPYGCSTHLHNAVYLL